MKCSEFWLREWVNPSLTLEDLANTLTMGGLEVESLTPVASLFTGVVIGQVLSINKHPEADRLQICEVDVGASERLNIVCGAPNVKVNMKAPVALVDAVLPNNIVIVPTSIRGVSSEGMLCSAKELGMADESDGLLTLPEDALLGQDVWSYLKLADVIIDISITPNRGDCLSIKGMAREISALTNTPMVQPFSISNKTTTKDKLNITISSEASCPRYVGRIIHQVKAALTSPLWLKEHLRRAGVRSISPIVDITNYVMLELGQPMHAFDLHKIKEGIIVRHAKVGEEISLLDDSKQKLDAETLVIADKQKPLAIAGVMGGLDSSVTSTTTDIFLESAYFSPGVVAYARQYYGLNSDSAYRFERGIDPTMQVEAIERATQLIVEIVGGEPGPITEVASNEYLPTMRTVSLTHEKITQVLGFLIPAEQIENIFKTLQFHATFASNSWTIDIPLYRPDLILPEDVIEEIARLYGYDNIPTHQIKSVLQANKGDAGTQDLHHLRQALCDQGYHEIITYSFIDKKLQALLDPKETPRDLLNPISADMSVMRTNLWPGLINTLIYNKSRQQSRIRLFEMGTCFITSEGYLFEQQKIGGLITGSVNKEQWGIPLREADFYDLKGNIENLLYPFKSGLTFKAETHAALHPGQTAGIYFEDNKLGLMGALHPNVMQALDLSSKVFVFELDLNLIKEAGFHQSEDISKFPEIRRDLAVLVNEAIPAEQIQDTIKSVAGGWLQNVFIFDVYQGQGIAKGYKSVALALILQDKTRTLVDDEVEALMERVILALKGQLGAELRS